jgi:hypothetical protein
MKRSQFIFVLMLAFSLFFTHSFADNDTLDFKLVNKTGYGIKEIYISPSDKEDWGENIISKDFENGDTLNITFHEKATALKWDIKIVWVDGGDSVYWKDNDLSKINTFTMFYNRDTKETSATTE